MAKLSRKYRIEANMVGIFQIEGKPLRQAVKGEILTEEELGEEIERLVQVGAVVPLIESSDGQLAVAMATVQQVPAPPPAKGNDPKDSGKAI